MNKVFPIQTETGCLFKWAWSTVYLKSGTTASCHRVTHDPIDLENFDAFHNTPRKIRAREMMLKGEWPGEGCEYCQNIEQSGGTSDRQLQLKLAIPKNVPPELMHDSTATHVTPTILEVYFSNVCNMSCLYCGPWFSTKWEEENKKFLSDERYKKSKIPLIGLRNPHSSAFNENYDEMTQKFFSWLEKNHQTISYLNIAGGESFYQPELELVLDFYDKHPSPHTQISLITNLKVPFEKFKKFVDRFLLLQEEKKIDSIRISGSLDCWGPQQEYIRWGLSLKEYIRNMEYLLDKNITIGINSAVNSLSIKTMPEFIAQMNVWNEIRKSHNLPKLTYTFMSVNSPEYMNPDIFEPGFFADDFKNILDVMSHETEDDIFAIDYMKGIAKQVDTAPKNPDMIEALKLYLNELDYRRGTNWRELFPWLEEQE